MLLLKMYNDFIFYFRYNDFIYDLLFRCNCILFYSGENFIFVRCDLNLVNGIYSFGVLGYRLYGGIDMKVIILYFILFI